MLLRRRSDRVEVLKQIPLFSALNNRQLDMIARGADEVKLLAGRVVTRQGGLRREMFIILEGTARVERDGKLIARLKPGHSFGEMSLIDGKPRSATVTAESDLVALVVDSTSFNVLLDSAPGLARKLLATLSERLRNADIQLTLRN